jgi:hypothetical protein
MDVLVAEITDGTKELLKTSRANSRRAKKALHRARGAE